MPFALDLCPKTIEKLRCARESCRASTERCGEITIIMAVHDRPPLVNGAFNASTLRAAADHLHLDWIFSQFGGPVVEGAARRTICCCRRNRASGKVARGA